MTLDPIPIAQMKKEATMDMTQCWRSFGVIGGLDPLAGADVFSKLFQSVPAPEVARRIDTVIEPHSLLGAGAASAELTKLKLAVFDAIQRFEQQEIDTVLLPCFSSHVFVNELKANSNVRIVDMMDALRDHIRRAFPAVSRIGVLAPDSARSHGLFEAYFPAPEFQIVHPRAEHGALAIMRAVHDAGETTDAARLAGAATASSLLRAACGDLIEQGAQVIVPGFTEIASMAERIGALSVPLIDANLVYAQYAASDRIDTAERLNDRRHRKIGILGGVGPAATVDFMNKIVRNTPATRDQDHVKIMVEQNPQIPDRTANLVGDGEDPTIAIYATCKKLEAGKADLIAIPCNTAHAFVERIQPYLSIPIINMLTVTAQRVRQLFPGLEEVGVLATSGTIASGVYKDALESCGLRQVVPSPASQERVMSAIYGEKGVKAGYTTGQCVDDIHAAVEELAARGIEVMILGCTELPLLLPRPQLETANGRTIALIDPTDTLAKHCVDYVLGATGRS